jgi:hypothetical protein
MKLLGRRWLQIFASGLVLLYLVERTLVATANLNYVPSVILLGAFLVPVTFVTYLYERLPDWDVPLPAVAVCFLWGGVLGTVVAGTLEYDVARALGFLPKLAIGLIEESAKLIVPLIFYFMGRYRSEAAGIVLGVATAAGFARQPGSARRGVAGARADLTCGAHGLDGSGMRRPVAREAREGPRGPGLASGRRLPYGGCPARAVGYLRERQERHVRRVPEHRVGKPAHRAAQPDPLDPAGA